MALSEPSKPVCSGMSVAFSVFVWFITLGHSLSISGKKNLKKAKLNFQLLRLRMQVFCLFCLQLLFTKDNDFASCFDCPLSSAFSFGQEAVMTAAYYF